MIVDLKNCKIIPSYGVEAYTDGSTSHVLTLLVTCKVSECVKIPLKGDIKLEIA